jgi:ribosomal protein S4E
VLVEVDSTITSQLTKLILQLHDGTSTNQIDVRISDASRYRVLCNSGNFSTIVISTATGQSGKSQLMFTFKNGNLSFFANGVKVGESATFTTFSQALSTIEVGRDRSANSVLYLNDHIRSVTLFNKAIPEATAIRLTT